jgi:hypothetical protein
MCRLPWGKRHDDSDGHAYPLARQHRPAVQEGHLEAARRQATLVGNVDMLVGELHGIGPVRGQGVTRLERDNQMARVLPDHTLPATYTTLEGDALDLRTLKDDERAYLAHCYAEFRGGVNWERFRHLSLGNENPLLLATGGWITPEVWRHPLFRAVRDLEYRLGIREGEIAPDPDDDLSRDPLGDSPLPTLDRASQQ